MALRQIRVVEDSILRKEARPVTRFDERLQTLIDDMIETMYHANGVGLAAPQIGILKRLTVIDVGEGVHVFINPEILETDGEQIGIEGCLSIPGKSGQVKRPNHVKVKALDRQGNSFVLEAEALFARAICHEVDHLNGRLFTDIAISIESETDN